MSEPYEYLPPHRPPPPTRFSKEKLLDWEVVIPWGSELITRKVSAVNKTKAFRKVVLQLSKDLNLEPSRMFQSIYKDKKYKVTQIHSRFLTRAASMGDPALDVTRMKRLPFVEDAYIYQRKGNEVTYWVVLKAKNTLAQAREVTGYVQSLFGSRLLSSGQTQTTLDNGEKRSIVEARVSLLLIVGT
jgi:hypothetical protein